ncbi:hypothetical protein A3862_28815 [Methylobacterium sp. XJLW]|nr:hypothetical protein A3862_28815 [Methylobacterium sp. XJLW]
MLQGLKLFARNGGTGVGFGQSILCQTGLDATGRLAAVFLRAEQDARRVALGGGASTNAVLTSLALGSNLCCTSGGGHLLLGIGEVVLSGRELQILLRTVCTPAATVSASGKRRDLHNRVHTLEKSPIMADDERSTAPIGQQSGNCVPTLSIEVVRRLIEQQEVWSRKYQGGERSTGALPA